MKSCTAIICAVDKALNFGNTDGSLPWGKPMPSDMKWFKDHTKAYGNCVMGVKTFMSLPSRLKGRKNIVLADGSRGFGGIKARDGSSPDLVLHYEPLLGFDFVNTNLKNAGINKYIVIGGAALIEHAVTFCDAMFITIVDKEFPADIQLNLPKGVLNLEESFKPAASKEERDGEEFKLLFAECAINKEVVD